MTVSIKWMLPAFALLFPLALPGMASAQSSDSAYCAALSDKYVQYLGMSQGRGVQPQSLDAQVALNKCSAADAGSSIPVLEKALKGAKLELPPRT
jgi:hypothetical protein